MKNRSIVYVCFFMLLTLNISFQWPVENVRVTSTFGESRGDHFHDGIDLISTKNNIHPVLEGDIVFLWDRSIFPTESYPGSGNYKVLKHKNGYYSPSTSINFSKEVLEHQGYPPKQII